MRLLRALLLLPLLAAPAAGAGDTEVTRIKGSDVRLNTQLRLQGGLITMEDLDKWQVYIEKPVSTSYKGVEVFKLTSWVQGPVMLQALNMLEDVDLKGMGFTGTVEKSDLCRAKLVYVNLGPDGRKAPIDGEARS